LAPAPPKLLAPKFDFVAKLAGKLLLEQTRALAGNPMNLSAPGGGGAFARKHVRTYAEHDEMKTKTPLGKIAPHDPIENVVEPIAGQGKG
jgi:hypothetical protein